MVVLENFKRVMRGKRKSQLFTALFFVFIVPGGFFLAYQMRGDLVQSIIPSVGEHGVHRVELRENGFYPKELTIAKGDIVQFTTTRDKPFWPASNLHPTHTIYSEFDPREPIEPGRSWSFRFDRVGRWQYHDHLFANYTGKITVVDQEDRGKKAVLTATSHCVGVAIGQKQQCWDEQLEVTLETQGLGAAFDLFGDLYRTEPSIPKACHGWGHILGEAAFDLYAEQKDFVLRDETSYCGYGFFHGFIEKLLQATGDITETRKFCDYISTKLGPRSGGAYINCIHGIGHGATAGASENPTLWKTFQDILNIGVQTCKQITDLPGELQACWEGVYNEFQQEINFRQYGFSIDFIKDDFFWVCREQEVKYQKACYFEFVGLLAEFSSRDFAKATSMIIDEISDLETAAYVMRKFSADFMQDDIVKPNYDDNVLACRRLPPSFYKPCFEGILIGFIAHGEPEKEYVKGLQFCRSQVLTKEDKDACYRTMVGQFRSYMYPEEKMLEVCREVEEEYKEYCIAN